MPGIVTKNAKRSAGLLTRDKLKNIKLSFIDSLSKDPATPYAVLAILRDEIAVHAQKLNKKLDELSELLKTRDGKAMDMSEVMKQQKRMAVVPNRQIRSQIISELKGVIDLGLGNSKDSVTSQQTMTTTSINKLLDKFATLYNAFFSWPEKIIDLDRVYGELVGSMSAKLMDDAAISASSGNGLSAKSSLLAAVKILSAIPGLKDHISTTISIDSADSVIDLPITIDPSVVIAEGAQITIDDDIALDLPITSPPTFSSGDVTALLNDDDELELVETTGAQLYITEDGPWNLYIKTFNGTAYGLILYSVGDFADAVVGDGIKSTTLGKVVYIERVLSADAVLLTDYMDMPTYNDDYDHFRHNRLEFSYSRQVGDELLVVSKVIELPETSDFDKDDIAALIGDGLTWEDAGVGNGGYINTDMIGSQAFLSVAPSSTVGTPTAVIPFEELDAYGKNANGVFNFTFPDPVVYSDLVLVGDKTLEEIVDDINVHFAPDLTCELVPYENRIMFRGAYGGSVTPQNKSGVDYMLIPQVEFLGQGLTDFDLASQWNTPDNKEKGLSVTIKSNSSVDPTTIHIVGRLSVTVAGDSDKIGISAGNYFGGTDVILCDDPMGIGDVLQIGDGTYTVAGKVANGNKWELSVPIQYSDDLPNAAAVVRPKGQISYGDVVKGDIAAVVRHIMSVLDSAHKTDSWLSNAALRTSLLEKISEAHTKISELVDPLTEYSGNSVSGVDAIAAELRAKGWDRMYDLFIQLDMDGFFNVTGNNKSYSNLMVKMGDMLNV